MSMLLDWNQRRRRQAPPILDICMLGISVLWIYKGFRALYGVLLRDKNRLVHRSARMSETDQIIYVVDDDDAFRESVVDLLNAWGFQAIALGTAQAYIDAPKGDRVSCLLLDVGLPGITGLELQRQLTGVPHPPIVFLTGRGDIPKAVQAMRAGAIEFLTKPFVEDDLIVAIRTALDQDRSNRATLAGLDELRTRFNTLTPREKEVLPLVIGGLLNKQAASELGISEVTYQVHRSRIMKKMRASSLAELVRFSSRLDIPIHARASKGAT
jgi:FixJ family two-component response regulator